MEIFKEFSIKAAHGLPGVPAGDKSGQPHFGYSAIQASDT
jgi:hypothetical protein